MSGGSKKFRAQCLGTGEEFHTQLAQLHLAIRLFCRQKGQGAEISGEPVGACRKGWRLEVLTATLNFPAVQAVSR